MRWQRPQQSRVRRGHMHPRGLGVANRANRDTSPALVRVRERERVRERCLTIFFAEIVYFGAYAYDHVMTIEWMNTQDIVNLKIILLSLEFLHENPYVESKNLAYILIDIFSIRIHFHLDNLFNY